MSSSLEAKPEMEILVEMISWERDLRRMGVREAG